MSVFKAVFFLLYRFLLAPLALTIIFIFLWPFHRKIQQGLRLRKQARAPLNLKQKPVWIHASSGEFEYAKPIITALKKHDPNIPVVVTYFSPSYAATIERFPGVEAALPLPFDLPGPTRSFVRHLDPAAFLVARTDLWPELLASTQAARVPSLLFSSSFRPLNGWRGVFKPYFRMLLDSFQDVFAVAKADSDNIASSHTRARIQVTGDTRYDQVVARLLNPKPLRREILRGGLPTLVAGSTWPDDEAVLLPATAPLIKAGRMRLILAPHEPTDDHLNSLEKQLLKLGVPSVRYSQAAANEFTDDKPGVLLIDQVGILAELYTAAQIAFVGGSFKSKVHSVMEPLAAGLPTLVGPYHHNNREALEFQRLDIGSGLKAVSVVGNREQMTAALDKLLSAHDAWAYQNSTIREAVQARTGASKQVVDWILQHYPHSSTEAL